ncbi:MAG: diphosphomevalonate decarboxylase [Caldithrix sp.]|nr:diphosphomevalonate decarboxylase [Caldithrix sp.]
MQAKAIARSNIALIKYWGKRRQKYNLPAVGSISITLDRLQTVTDVGFSSSLEKDRFTLNGHLVENEQLERVSRFLNLIRKKAGFNDRAQVITTNNFPTAAGLASSASGFAALTLAACKAAGLDFTKKELSILARQGSGSAARSIYGGFVHMYRGQSEDGHDAYAEQIATEKDWDLSVVIAITQALPKETGSTSGMVKSRETSPYYDAWVETGENDLKAMKAAIDRRDFTHVGQLCEYSCLKMHALALSTRPAIIYWNGITLDVMHTIRQLRKEGREVYFTIDAGPQVKAICRTSDRQAVQDRIQQIEGIKQILTTNLGGDAELID